MSKDLRGAVYRHRWGAVGSLGLLLQIFSWFWQWNKFENRSIFYEVIMYKTKCVSVFWGHAVESNKCSSTRGSLILRPLESCWLIDRLILRCSHAGATFCRSRTTSANRERFAGSWHLHCLSPGLSATSAYGKVSGGLARSDVGFWFSVLIIYYVDYADATQQFKYTCHKYKAGICAKRTQSDKEVKYKIRPKYRESLVSLHVAAKCWISR